MRACPARRDTHKAGGCGSVAGPRAPFPHAVNASDAVTADRPYFWHGGCAGWVYAVAKAIDVSIQAGLHQDPRAQRTSGRCPLQTAALRHPETRRATAALRPAARARWRVQILGCDPRA